MAEIVKEKVFEHFLEFPADVRMVVINEMSIEDRCRFTRCSSICQNEAQKAKNYIYGMRFEVYNQHRLTFSVIYHEEHKNNKHGDYKMRFSSRFNRTKCIVYSNRLGVELWRSGLDSSINITEYAFGNVKNMLNKYQKTIKMLCLDGVRNYDFGIQSLRNLESLTIGYNTDIRRIMSKIRKPLKEFECSQILSEIFTGDIEQIFEVQNLLKIDRTRLNYEQFQKLSAQKIHMNIGILNEENISDFIQSWQNDKLRNNFISCLWDIYALRFDVQKLLRFLGIHRDINVMQPWGTIDIRHNMDATKKAELGFNQTTVEFRVIKR